MEALRRWTPSVFLVLALNIGCILNQNVGPNHLYLPKALQGASCTQCTPKQPPNVVPISQSSCTNLGPLNTLNLQSSSCSGTTGPAFKTPGALLPLPQPTVPQEQSPIGAVPFTPGLAQQNLRLAPLEKLPTQGPVLPFNQGRLQNPGIDVCSGPQQGPSLCQQLDSSPLPNSVSFLGNSFTPFGPMVNPGFTASFTDMPPLQGIALPPRSLQGISGMSSPFNTLMPLNNEEAVEVFSPGSTQCSSALTGLPVNSLSPTSNRLPIQEQTLPASQKSCFPQGSAFIPQCDILPEPFAASVEQCPSSIGPTSNSLPFSPINMFRFQRPTLFPSASSFQDPLAYNYPLPCDSNYACAPTPNPGSVFANPALSQQELIYPQVPPASALPNILPGLPNQNLQLLPLQSSSVSQPTLNLGPYSLADDVASFHILPPLNVTPYSSAIPPNGFGAVLPQVTNSVDFSPFTPPLPCFKDAQSFLPSAFNIPYDSSGLFPPAIANTVPNPINLQINVPPPIIPAPQITIINASPASDTAVSTATEDSSFFDLPYPMPPIIMEGRRSSSRSWLPLVLVALFGDMGGYGGGCSCDSGPTPIPFPIPIPTNNPIIVNK